MHSDVEALDVVCRHYRVEYGINALRKAKNKITRLMRVITRLTIELFYVRALQRVWMRGTLT